MRVLVTGATGFVGGHVAQYLQQQGYRVTATGRNQGIGSTLNLPFLAADLSDSEQAFKLCEQQDAIVHCAGLSSPWGKTADFQRHNEQVTAHLLAAKAERFIYMSSSGVYFAFDERVDVRESDPLPSVAQHPYIESKRRSEERVKRTDNWVILRPRAIYGPGDTAILPRILRLMKTGLLPVIGSGHNLASLTYVHNLSQAVELSLRGPTESIFNITDGRAVELWPLLKQLAGKLGLPPIRWRLPSSVVEPVVQLIESAYRAFLPHREPPISPYTLSLLNKSQTLDIGEAQSKLGYEPKFSTELAVHKTLEELSV